MEAGGRLADPYTGAGHPDANSHADRYAYPNRDTHSHPYADRYANTDRNTYCHAHANSDARNPGSLEPG